MAMQGAQGQQGAQGAPMQAGPTPRVNIQEFENKLDAMPDSQLKQLAQNPSYMTNAMYGPLINAELTRRVSARQSQQVQQQGQQQGQQGQQPTVVQQAQQTAMQLPEDSGIAQLPARNIEQMADGGIVALAGGGDPEDGVYIPEEELVGRLGNEDEVLLGGDERSSPAGRFIRSLSPQPSTRTNEPSRLQLMDAIKREYEGRAGASGFFMTQTDEERQQAKDIMQQARRMYSEGDTKGLLAIAQSIPGSSVDPNAKNAVGDIGELGYNTDKPTGSQSPRMMPPRAAAPKAPPGPAEAAARSAAAQQGLGATPAGQAATGGGSYEDYIKKGMDLIKGVRPDYTELRNQEVKEREGLAALNAQAAANADLDKQEYLDFIKRRGEYGKGREERLAKQEEGLEKRREEAKGMALFQAGMAILAAPPGRGAAAAIGVGAQSGLKMYQGDMEKLQAAADKIQAARDALEDIRYKELTADESQLRALASKKRQIELDGGKGLFDISRRYGYDITKSEADAAFKGMLEAQQFGVQAGLGLGKLVGAERVEQIQQKGLIDRAGIMANRPGGRGGQSEDERKRVEANKKWVDPILRQMAVAEAQGKGVTLRTLGDYERYLGIPSAGGADSGRVIDYGDAVGGKK